MKTLFKKILVIWALFLGFVGGVFAAVPAEVTTALTDAKADALTVATAFLVAIIALAAFMLMRRGAH